MGKHKKNKSKPKKKVVSLAGPSAEDWLATTSVNSTSDVTEEILTAAYALALAPCAPSSLSSILYTPIDSSCTLVGGDRVAQLSLYLFVDFSQR